jgi:NAD(P)-dependent dehydrogenase (short-subunit alcohol dehydrogenase family)
VSRLRVAISAGANGIGRAIAEHFIRADADVAICDVDDVALRAFRQAHPDATVMRADVGNPAEVDAFFDGIGSKGQHLDILVNNAGIAGPTARLEDISVEDWQDTINIDLNSYFYCARRAIPMIRRAGGGSIVNIASNAAFFGFPLRSPYAASKWAIVGLTKTLAMELGPEGVRVNAICPGSVAGPRIDRVIARDAEARGLTPEQVATEYKSQSSLRCFVTAEDVVGMVSFLTSDAGRRISGQAIGLDGHTEGLSLQMRS